MNDKLGEPARLETSGGICCLHIGNRASFNAYPSEDGKKAYIIISAGSHILVLEEDVAPTFSARLSAAIAEMATLGAPKALADTCECGDTPLSPQDDFAVDDGTGRRHYRDHCDAPPRGAGMTTEVATRRVLRRGFPSPLALPCYADDAGAPVPYAALGPAERVRLAIALHDYLHEVTRVVSTRCVALQSDVLCVIDAVVRS